MLTFCAISCLICVLIVIAWMVWFLLRPGTQNKKQNTMCSINTMSITDVLEKLTEYSGDIYHDAEDDGDCSPQCIACRAIQVINEAGSNLRDGLVAIMKSITTWDSVQQMLKEAKEQMPVDEKASAAFLADPYITPAKVVKVLHRRKRISASNPEPVCPKGFLQKSRAYIKAMLQVIPQADEAASERDSDESERRWESLPKRPILRKRDPSEATTANKETNDA